VLAIQQVRADSKPHSPDVLRLPRHYPGNVGMSDATKKRHIHRSACRV
jgi:hypothetical protein